jgi:hypothetical protein
VTKARDTQAAIEVAYVGVPKARLGQAAIEVAHLGSPKARLAQAVIEVAYTEGVAPPAGGQRFYAQVIG